MKRKHRRPSPPPAGRLAASGSPSPRPARATARWFQSPWLLGGLIFVATLLVYWPALHGGFIWDDDDHIVNNETLRNLNGLRDIWTAPGATMQYYPLSFSVWWLDYHLWKLDTVGYHLQNVLLHSLVSILLWQVLKRLRVPGAWLAGAIFALHPVNVMSVAWMTELKNTLSCTLALASAWAYLRFAGLGVYEVPNANKPAWRFYILSLVLFLLAMCAKTAVSFLPVSLLLLTWWQRERLKWPAVWPLLPMVGIVAVMGQITFYVEHHSGGASGPDFNIDWVHRILISGRSFWFYLGELFFPHQQAFIYPRWDVEPGVWWQWLFPLATAGLLIGAWLLRKRVGKGVFAGLLHFYVGTSFLILLTVLYMTVYSFVADHWQYFGCMGIIALAAAGIVTALGRFGKGTPFLKPAFCGLLLLVLGVLSWRQCGMYSNIEKLWRVTIQRDPYGWMPCNNLGYELLQEKRVDEAIVYFKKALAIYPSYAEAHNNLGIALVQEGDVDEAITNYETSLEFKPDFLDAHYNLGVALLQKGRLDEAMPHFQKVLELNPDYADADYNLGVIFLQKQQPDDAIRYFQKTLAIQPDYAEAEHGLGLACVQKGQLDEAIAHFRKTIEMNPDHAQAHNNLGRALLQEGRVDEAIVHFQKALAIAPGTAEFQNNLAWVLATCPIASFRNGDRAVDLAQSANQLTGDANPDMLGTLAAAYAETGQFPQAIATVQRAIQLAGDQNNSVLAGTLQKHLASYQAGLPLRSYSMTNGMPATRPP